MAVDPGPTDETSPAGTDFNPTLEPSDEGDPVEGDVGAMVGRIIGEQSVHNNKSVKMSVLQAEEDPAINLLIRWVEIWDQ